MENINVLLWAVGGGFAGTWMMMLFMIKKLDHRLEKIEDRLSKVEHDMIEVKTILRMKECCMIQDERKLPKAE